MSVINFTPHQLDYQVAGEGYDDPETGDYVPASSHWVERAYDVHAVPAGPAGLIPLPDGKMEQYSYVISQLPTDCIEFKYGQKIRLRIGETLVELAVKGFHRYQLQAKIWA